MFFNTEEPALSERDDRGLQKLMLNPRGITLVNVQFQLQASRRPG